MADDETLTEDGTQEQDSGGGEKAKPASGGGSALDEVFFSEGDELDLEAVYDVPLEVEVVLGEKTLSITELLDIGSGSVIELDRKVGEPVDVYVNKRLVARGEIVIVEDHIGVTMTEIFKGDVA